MDTIGKRIRFYRSLYGKDFTGEKLGELAFGKADNAAQQKISRIETDRQSPKIDELQRIAYVLQIRVDDLLTPYIHPEIKSRLKNSIPRKYPT